MNGPSRMSEPIKVGDLVQMVRPAPCCGNTVGMGHVFRVYGLTTTINVACLACRKQYWDVLAVVGDYPLGGHILSRLKRIPPLSELEGEKRDEKLKETA